MLSDGFKLLVIGMGTVFIFLALMNVIIQLASKLLAPFNHLVPEKQAASIPKAKASPVPANDAALVAAAAAAVRMYQDEHK